MFLGLDVYMPFLLDTINMVKNVGNDYTKVGQAFVTLSLNFSKIKPLGMDQYSNGIFLQFGNF